MRKPARHVDQRAQLFLVTDSLAIKLDDDRGDPIGFVRGRFDPLLVADVIKHPMAD